MKIRALRWKVATLIGLVLFTSAYGMPLWAELFDGRLYTNLLDFSKPDWGKPLLRSISFAAITVTLQVIFGFVGAVALKNVSRHIEKLFVILLVPALLGSLPVGFVFRLIVLQHLALSDVISARTFLPTWTTMIAVQCWQYLPLFLYIFWLRLQTVPRSIEDYAASTRLSPRERVRDIYWPYCRNVAVLLSFFGAIQGVQEFIKFQLILRASQGTGTELITHRLLRFYSSASPVNPSLATVTTLSYCVIVFAVGLICTALIALLVTGLITVCTKIIPERNPFNVERKSISDISAVFVISLILGPLAGVRKYLFHWGFIDLNQFTISITLTIAALSIVLAIAILFGICTRLIWPHVLADFNRWSLLLLIALYSLLLVPPIGIALCGYEWLSVLGRSLQSQAAVITLWLIGQTILTLPILSSFVMYNHFHVKVAELHFQKSISASFFEVARYSFFSRFRIEYALLALFGFSVIWSEATLSSVMSGLSPNLPSIAVELTQRVDGRGASYYEAMNLILFSLSPILSGIMLWGWLWGYRNQDWRKG
jgi:ABC-type sugar transport system permease subunit